MQLKSVEDFFWDGGGGLIPTFNAELLKIFLKLFYFAQDFQTHFNAIWGRSLITSR